MEMRGMKTLTEEELVKVEGGIIGLVVTAVRVIAANPGVVRGAAQVIGKGVAYLGAGQALNTFFHAMFDSK